MTWMPTPQQFAAASFVLVVVIAFCAAAFRNRFYAYFISVLLSLHAVISAGIYPLVGSLSPLFVYLQAATMLHFAALVWPRMRGSLWRMLISVPAHVFAGGTFLALPWAVPSAFGLALPGWWLPYAIALTGLVESYWLRLQHVDLTLDGDTRHAEPTRTTSRAGNGEPLRIVQITDPHLGPWMSVDRLRRICERAVARDPDLVLLTGDFLTMESQDDARHLAEALAPLSACRGRVFACRGNHDHEAPEVVASALDRIGARLLIDEEAVASTRLGEVQILGLDFAWAWRRERMAEVCARHPRRGDLLRIVLLHDPGAFKHLPEGEGDLVLSGHTHGGQLGLVTLGLSWTVVSSVAKMPDHGLFARGRDRLYVHRGTGHYGFPVRLGVPAEESVLRVWRSE